MLNFEHFLKPIWFVCRITGFWILSLKSAHFYSEILLKTYFLFFAAFHLYCSYFTFGHFTEIDFANASLVPKYADSLVIFISIWTFYFCGVYNFCKRHIWLDIINRLNSIHCTEFDIVKDRNFTLKRLIFFVLYYILLLIISSYLYMQHVKNLSVFIQIVCSTAIILHFVAVHLLQTFLKYIRSCLEEVNFHLKILVLNSSSAENEFTSLIKKYYELMYLFSSLFSLLSLPTILFLLLSFITTTVYINYSIKSFVAYFYGHSEIISDLVNIIHIFVFLSHNYTNISIVDATKKEVCNKLAEIFNKDYIFF